ncbi:hypothetical protein [Marinimicrobium agarilyticum]|uniref:hypothetical protein n=1 Tax=Marinimicrobium agarilyticum TaxID=306546 RepID=UPI00042A159D|nr:hypothetical protein [Marinimicrobium agarilyticum]
MSGLDKLNKSVVPLVVDIEEEVLDVIDAADHCVIFQVDGVLQLEEVSKLCKAAKALVRKLEGECGQ